MNKKFLSLILVLCLVLTVGISAGAKTTKATQGIVAAPSDEQNTVPEHYSSEQDLQSFQIVPNSSSSSNTHQYTVLLLDTVSSYYLQSNGSIIYTVPTSISAVKQAAQQFVNSIFSDTSSVTNHVAIISFGSTASIKQNFTTSASSLTKSINNLSETSYNSNLNSALTSAETLLDGISDANAIKNIVMFLPECPSYGSNSSSGKYTASDCSWLNLQTYVELYKYANSAYKTADRLKENYNLYSIGLFSNLEDVPNEGRSYLDFCKQFVKDVQNKGYYEASNLAELIEAFNLTALELIDTDGDALPDIWETNGYDTIVDGVKVHVALDEMGADPNVKDIFVEIDWMVRPDGKNLRPTQAQIDKVIDAFQNAPVTNGIRLHVDFGGNSYDRYTQKNWSQISGGSLASSIDYNETISFNEWSEMIEDNFTSARAKAFHYCIFANKYDFGDGDNSSGVALGGTDNTAGQFFIISRGIIHDDDTAIAGTFMHELGHTLGLDHGGGDGENYKPNYLSVMNYLYQFSGLVGTGNANGNLDYSRVALPTLNENSLNENNGIDPNGLTAGTGLGTLIPINWWTTPFVDWYQHNGKWFQRVENISRQRVNFDHSVNIIGIETYQSSVKANLNPGGNDAQGDFGTLTGYNDWANLKFKGKFSSIGMGGTLAPDTNIEYDQDAIPKEISVEHALQIGLIEANYNLSPITLQRKNTTDAFNIIDTVYVDWISSNPQILDIDNDGNVTHGQGHIGTVTITAVDNITGEELGCTQVKTTWSFWQWILVIIALGWLYL